MKFDWAFAWSVMPQLMRGLGETLKATLLGIVLAATLGLLWAIARRSRWRALAWPVGGAVEFIRSTPLLVQIYFLFYVMPDLGIRLSPLATGILALGLHYSAYMAEVYRAGIEGVPRGQWEAARALNLSAAGTWVHVILPQAIPPVVPALGNYFVALLKDTPMLSAITVLELLQRAKIIGSETFRYLEPLTMVGLLFLIVSLGASGLIRLATHHLIPRRSA